MFRDSKEVADRLDLETNQKTPSIEGNLERKRYLNRVLMHLNPHETSENINNYIEEILKAYAANTNKEAALRLELLTFKLKLDPITEADLALFYLETKNYHKAKLNELRAVAGLRKAEEMSFLSPSEMAILYIQVGILFAKNSNQNLNMARHYLAKGLYSDCELAFLYPKLIENIISTTVKINLNFGKFFAAVLIDTTNPEAIKKMRCSSGYEKLALNLKNTLSNSSSEQSKLYFLLLFYSMAYWLIYSGNDTDSYSSNEKENLLKKYKQECLQLEEKIKAQTKTLENDSPASAPLSDKIEIEEDFFTKLDKDLFNDSTQLQPSRKTINQEIINSRLETFIKLNPTKSIELLKLMANNINEAFTLIITDKKKNLAEAKCLLLDAINACNISADAFYVLATILVEEKNYLESIETNKKGEENGIVVGDKVKWNIKKNANYFYANFYLGNFKEALSHAVEFLKEDIESSLSYEDKEPLLQFWDKLHPAENLSKPPTKNAEDRAKDFYKQKKYHKAIEYINAAINQSPNKAALYFFRAKVIEAKATTKQDCLEALFNFHLAEWLTVKKYSLSLTELDKQSLKKHCQTLNTKLKSFSENNAASAPLVSVDLNSSDFDNEKIEPNKIIKDKSKNKKNKDTEKKPRDNKETTSGNHEDTVKKGGDDQSQPHATITKPTPQPQQLTTRLTDLTEQDFTLVTHKAKPAINTLNQQPRNPVVIKPTTMSAVTSSTTDRMGGRTLTVSNSASRHTQPHLQKNIKYPSSVKPVTQNISPAPVVPLVTKPIISDATSAPIQSSPQMDSPQNTIPKINLPTEGKFILDKLKENGHCLSFAVGGVVRDQLIDCEKHGSDIDIVTSATVEQLKLIFPLADFPKQQFLKDGKLLQIYKDNQKIDIWLSETLHQHQIALNSNKVSLNHKQLLEILKCDALTRDFNISTLYADENGNVLDPLDVYGCETIDTVNDPNDLFTKSPICMLRAIYLSIKVGLPLAEGVSIAIEQNIKSLSRLSITELRPLLGRILHLSNSHEISKEFDRLNFVNILFPYFNSFSSQEIIERLASDDPLNWIFANLIIDSSVTRSDLSQLETIEDMQLRFQALQKIYENIKTKSNYFKTSNQFNELFPHEDVFLKLLQKAIEANPKLNRLMIEWDVLKKTLPLIKNQSASSVESKVATKSADASTITQEQDDEAQQLQIEQQNQVYPYAEEQQFAASSEFSQPQMGYVYPPNPYFVPQQFIYPQETWQMTPTYLQQPQYPQPGFWYHPQQFQQAQFFNASVQQQAEYPSAFNRHY